VRVLHTRFSQLAVAVLEKRPDLDEEELLDILSSNLCRCTGYANIIKAMRAGIADMKARA
jgi:aerobic carbon-monoxide dehydrogenase small subunit